VSPAALVIRSAGPADATRLRRLAELDDRPLPPEPLLVAEVDGRLWAAVSLAGLEHIADPFQPSAAVTELAVARARQLRGDTGRPRKRVRWRRRFGVRETLAGECP
jgi:hypothetical protein